MFILAEEPKDSNMNKISETKTSKDNSSGAANAMNNKNKSSKHKKNYQKSNTNPSTNTNSSMKCTCCGQDGNCAMKCFKKPQRESWKGNPENPIGSKNINLMILTLQKRNNLKNSKHGVKSSGGMVTISPETQRWKMLNEDKKKKEFNDEVEKTQST